MEKTVSPSRTYVAICVRKDEDWKKRLYCVKFKLPDSYNRRNNSAVASWYFMGAINSLIQECIAFEDFSDLRTIGEEALRVQNSLNLLE